MSLQDLPPELVERIVVLLPLHDLCALRLVGTALALKATQEHFKTSFRTKQLEVTESRLHLFMRLTEHSSLVYLLKDLTLTEPIYNTQKLEALLKENVTDAAVLDDEGIFVELGSRELTVGELHSVERNLEILRQRRKEQLGFQQSCKAGDLLGQAFNNLAKHGIKLRRLRTEVFVYRDDAVTRLMPLYGGSWKYIWSSAARVTKLLFSSLAASGLSTETLNLFNSSRMQRCSLSCNEISDVDYSSDELRNSLANVEALSLSLSDKIIVRSDKDEARSEDSWSPYDVTQREEFKSNEEVLQEAKEEANFVGLQKLLQNSDHLRDLDILRYSLEYDDHEVTDAHCKGVLGTLENAQLPMLQTLTLQGFYVTEAQLFNTLHAHGTLKRLSLRCITILEGSFKRVLDYCTLESLMEEVELENLCEPKIVIFEPQWPPATTTTTAQSVSYPGAYYQWSRARPEGARGSGIKYHLGRSRIRGSPAIQTWRQDLKNRYGPPRYGVPSCVRDYLRPAQTWQI